MGYFSTPAIWRNGITNTAAVVDRVRERHSNLTRANNKAFAAFCADLDAEMEAWFLRTRVARPETYEEAEQVWQDHLAQGIAARSDETLQAAQPEGQEPGPKDAPTPHREQTNDT